MKRFLLLLFVIMVGCQKQAVKKETADTLGSAKNTIDFVGTYKGILPCADCDGLEIELAINENSTFWIKTKYQGKGEKVFMQKGHFTWDKKGNTIILTEVTTGPNKYIVGKNTLTQLNIYGEKVTGNLEDEYILAKQPRDTSDFETVSKNNTQTVDLDSRISTTTVIQKVNPAVGKYPLAETKWKLISLNKEKVVQKGENIYFLQLNSKNGRFSAYSGCNDIGGNYIMSSSSALSFSKTISTKMACADMVLESHFFYMLAETHSYKLNEETLTLFGINKKELALFKATK